MRYIDNRRIRLPHGWSTRAAAARADVAAGTCTIDDRKAVWKELKDALAGLSHDKCWYCEAKQERSDNAVDHFRPKGRVAECPGHTGYTWLAFAENNYRYSCTYCNSRHKGDDGQTKGKGDSFPLVDESKRAHRAGDEANENPRAIDPCRSGEPGWLDWHEDGRPVSKYPKNDLQNIKAECAIFLYHLDHQGACEARLSIAINLKSWIQQGQRHYLNLGDGNLEAEQSWCDRCQDISAAIADDAPYSAFAKRIVKMMKSEAPWLDDLV